VVEKEERFVVEVGVGVGRGCGKEVGWDTDGGAILPGKLPIRSE